MSSESSIVFEMHSRSDEVENNDTVTTASHVEKTDKPSTSSSSQSRPPVRLSLDESKLPEERWPTRTDAASHNNWQESACSVGAPQVGTGSVDAPLVTLSPLTTSISPRMSATRLVDASREMASQMRLQHFNGLTRDAVVRDESDATSSRTSNHKFKQRQNNTRENVTQSAQSAAQRGMQMGEITEVMPTTAASPNAATPSLHPATHPRLVDSRTGGCSLLCGSGGGKRSLFRRIRSFFTPRKKRKDSRIRMAAGMTTPVEAAKCVAKNGPQLFPPGLRPPGLQDVVEELDDGLRREERKRCGLQSTHNEDASRGLMQRYPPEDVEEREEDELRENQEESESYGMHGRSRSSSSRENDQSDNENAMDGGESHEEKEESLDVKMLCCTPRSPASLYAPQRGSHNSSSSRENSISSSFLIDYGNEDMGFSSAVLSLQNQLEGGSALTGMSVPVSGWPLLVEMKKSSEAARRTAVAGYSYPASMMPLTGSPIERKCSSSSGWGRGSSYCSPSNQRDDVWNPVKANNVSRRLTGGSHAVRVRGGVNGRGGSRDKKNNVANQNRKQNKKQWLRDSDHGSRVVPPASQRVGELPGYARLKKMKKKSTGTKIHAKPSASEVFSSSLGLFSSAIDSQPRSQQYQRVSPDISCWLAGKGDVSASVADSSPRGDRSTTCRSGDVRSYVQLAAKRRKYMERTMKSCNGGVKGKRCLDGGAAHVAGRGGHSSHCTPYDTDQTMTGNVYSPFPFDPNSNTIVRRKKNAACEDHSRSLPSSKTTWRAFKAHFYLGGNTPLRDARCSKGDDKEPITEEDEDSAQLTALAASLRLSCAACRPKEGMLSFLASLWTSGEKRMLLRFPLRESLYETQPPKHVATDAACDEPIPPSSSANVAAAAASWSTKKECREADLGGVSGPPSVRCITTSPSHGATPAAADGRANSATVDSEKILENCDNLDALFARRFPLIFNRTERASLDTDLRSYGSGGHTNSISTTKATFPVNHGVPLSSSDARSDATCAERRGSLGGSSGECRVRMGDAERQVTMIDDKEKTCTVWAEEMEKHDVAAACEQDLLEDQPRIYLSSEEKKK